MITTSAAAASPMEFMLQIAPGATGGLPVIGTGLNNFKSNASAEVSADAVKWNGLTTVALPLIPTVAGRTLDVSATGEAGIDWANIGSPTTAQNLSATNIDVDQIVASVSGAVGSVTGAVGSVAGAVGSVTAGVTVTTNNDKTAMRYRQPGARR